MARRSLLVLFLLSGALSLGYQVLWGKYVLEFTGVSAWAYAIVLAAFMGGLALGSAWLGPLADRVASPLTLYAGLELLVGLYALAYAPLAGAVAAIYGGLVHDHADTADASTFLWAKALAAGVLLLPPTILMGGTLPALVRHATESLATAGRRVCELYAVNALGAVLGSLAMAFVVLPRLGLHRSLLTLAGGNAVVGLGALVLARCAPVRPRTWPEDAASEKLPPREIRLALVLATAAGLASFLYEIAWTRCFGLVLGSSTYSFAVTLAAFISGIALGSAWLTRFEASIDRPLAVFGWTQLGAALLVVLPLPLYTWLPWLVGRLIALFAPTPAAFVPYEIAKLLLGYLVMLPPTLLLGMSFPLLVKGLTTGMAELGRHTGRIYAWNTLGNVLGALSGGLFLLPWLGMEKLLRGAALASAVVGAAAVLTWDRRDGSRRLALAATLSAIVIGSVAVGGWDPAWFALGAFRRGAQSELGNARQWIQGSQNLLFEDDPAGNLLVQRVQQAGDTYILVNGKTDASAVGDLPTQILLGHIPALLHPAPHRALVIGLASGITAHSALTHSLDRLDAVELMAAMTKATRLFAEFNGDVLADPCLHVIHDDARSYLSHTVERYDVIISEPSNPWMAGTGSLFSREFYVSAAAKLTPGGLFVQWVQGYEMSDPTFAAIVRGFRASFRHVYGFQGVAVDMLLVGSQQPIVPDWDLLERRLAQPAVKADLGRIGISGALPFLYLQRFSPVTVDFLAAGAEHVNTDDNLFLEHQAPRDLFTMSKVGAFDALDERSGVWPSSLWVRYLRERPERADLAAILASSLDSRMLVRGLARAQLAAWRGLHDDALTGLPAELVRRLPYSVRFPVPIDAPRAARELLAASQSGDGQAVGVLLADWRTGILYEAAWSAERAAYWLARSEEALAVVPPAAQTPLVLIRAELLQVAGRADEAADVLRDGLTRGLLAPDPALVLSACRIDRGGLCAELLAVARRRDGPPILLHFADLISPP